MKNIRWTILAAIILAVPTAAHAQAPGMPAGAPGAPGSTTTTTTTTTAAPDSGIIDTSVPTITTSTGIEPSSTVTVTHETTSRTISHSRSRSASHATVLANTGGEPFVISMLGLSMAAGAFFLRRRVTG